VLLTAVVVLGVLVHGHRRLPGLTRHAGLSWHRCLALLALLVLAAHVAAAVLAPYGGIGLPAVVVPFVSGREPLWIGLGAVALDLLAALVVTSLLRARLGWRWWRAVHWLAYACWPAAMAHSLGIGPGMRNGRLLDLSVACIAAVVLAGAWRLAGTLRAVPRARRVPALMNVPERMPQLAAAGDRTVAGAAGVASSTVARQPGPARLLPAGGPDAGPGTGHDGLGANPAVDLDSHLDRLGPVPYRGGPGLLIGEIRAAGLTGRGGVAFPACRKMEAVAARSGCGDGAVVVGNGAEGEPASDKDKTLLRVAPHLVLDGLQLAAEAVGASRAILAVSRDTGLGRQLRTLIAERSARGLDRVRAELVAGPPRFLAGEDTALASVISGGAAVPRFTPPRVSERGVDRRPTLVQNVETLAHMALIARHGPEWFRAAGTPEEPGTMLCTLRRADGSVTVAEAALGTALDDLHCLSGTAAVLIGGYHGAWVPATTAAGLALSNASLQAAGASVGTGLVAALPEGRCGLAETARVSEYLALESAGQCGPCLNAMPRLATELARLATLGPPRDTLGRLGRWAGLVQGRGACRHPDGTVRLIGSALRTFADEIRLHQHGRCSATCNDPFLPLPATPTASSDWR
jgi:NADH:ubiquinone oxidoreductase subunit F (NADH-binding)/DMSO/TMAO reductase YedYZ heme-binding membrane subunit